MTGLIILAAGESSRMGRPKQQLIYKNKQLLQHAIDNSLASHCKPVVVILGAYTDEILAGIKYGAVTIIHNKQWQEGMASSIRAGIAQLQKNEEITAAMIILCDQPFVDAGLINSLVLKRAATKKGIIACSYGNTIGVPVLFDRAYFSRLMQLQGNDGAKKILAQFKDDTALIPFALGHIDIDTPGDYEKLL